MSSVIPKLKKIPRGFIAGKTAYIGYAKSTVLKKLRSK